MSGFEPAFHRFREDLVQRAAGDGATAEPGDHRVNEIRRAGIGGGHVVRHDSAHAHGEALLEHDDALCAGKRRADRDHGPGTEATDAEHADPRTLLTHLVHGVLDRAEHGAECHDHGLGILEAVAAHEAAALTAEDATELVGPGRDEFERLPLLGVGEIAHLHERLGPDHGADRDRVGRVEHLARRVGGQVGIDLLLRRQVDALVGVGEDEPIHAHHHRQRELLAEPEGLDVQVERLLVVLREELDPAAVALAQRVGVVVPDVDRRADRAVRDRHHDRQAEPRGVVDRLRHEEQSLARGRRVRARAGRRRADGHRHCRELGFDVDELAG